MHTLRARMSRPILTAFLGCLLVVGMSAVAVAQGAARVASDEPAGFVVFPKIVVDTNGRFSDGVRVDTVVQLTNMSDDLIRVNCWYVNGNQYCDNAPDTACRTNADCPAPGRCQASDCRANDFQLTLTPRQPLAWRVSAPPAFLPCDPANPNLPTTGCLEQNETVSIPMTEDPFVGELKCVEVDDSDAPVARNDIKGEATIYHVQPADPPIADSASYNAIGIQALSSNNGDADLALDGAEYARCPAVLILNHFFEGARSPITGMNRISTELTLVPCSEDLSGVEDPVKTAAQMLIYNEFEQRFSTSRRTSCMDNVSLSDVDSRPGPDDDAYSIFAIGTQGTLTGQTRIRGVGTTSNGMGNGLLAVAQEYHVPAGDEPVIGSAAFNVGYAGERRQSDLVHLSVP